MGIVWLGQQRATTALNLCHALPFFRMMACDVCTVGLHSLLWLDALVIAKWVVS